MTRFVALVAALPLVVACGAAETTRTVTAADRPQPAAERTETTVHDDSCPSQLVRHRVRSPRFSIGVPEGWGIYDQQNPASKKEIALLRSDDPAFAAYLEAMRKPNSPFVLFAVRCGGDDGYATNMNVVAIPIPAEGGFEDFRAGAIDGIAATGAEPEVEDLMLPAGRAVRLSYQRELGSPGVETMVAVTQYFVYARGHAYILTYGTLPHLADTWVGVFDASARSLRAG
jgi:hypothetical protein